MTMLKSVIEKNYIRTFLFFYRDNLLNRVDSLLVNYNQDVGELLFDLKRFVANISYF